MDNILTLKDVTKTFGGLTALNNVTLTAQQGLVNMLIGPNGSGKTTLINCVTGFYKPDTGTIMYNGDEITGLQPHKIYDLGLVRTFQIPQPFQNLTVLENLKLAAYACTDAGELQRNFQRVFSLFPRLEERKNQRGETLSGGEQQMLAVARALMTGGKLMLLDEPSMGLAPVLMQELFRVLKEINQEGTTILLVEQNARMALRFASRGYVLETGNVVLKGSSEELAENPEVKRAYLGG